MENLGQVEKLGEAEGKVKAMRKTSQQTSRLIPRFTWQLALALGVSAVALLGVGVTSAQKGVADYDIQHYKLDVELIPAQQQLRARAEVQLLPQNDTRTVVLELNGSLTVKRVLRLATPAAPAVAVASAPTPAPVSAPVTAQPPALRRGDASTRPATNPAPAVSAAARPATPVTGNRPATSAVANRPAGSVLAASTSAAPTELQFIQDNRENMNLRIDLGAVAKTGELVALAVEYEGALESPQGGPINNARLAYVGEQGSYLFYAARWFPFHEYAADRATYEINLTVPAGTVVAGYSERPVVEMPVTVAPATSAGRGANANPNVANAAQAAAAVAAKGAQVRFQFVSTKPVLPGNLAAGKYLVRNFKQGGFDVDVFVKAGDEKWADSAAKIIGEHLEFYSTKFGAYPFGNKLQVVETDDETLETYSGAGTIFLSPRALMAANEEKLGREVAYQWWGQAVGVRSFDDIFVSQALAEFSMLLAVRDRTNETQFQQAIQAQLEKALAFEQSASIRNAPKQLDDQTPAYRSVMFHKGALVLYMLRQLMGEKEFDQMLRNYYLANNGKNVTLDEFEAIAAKAAGRNLRFFFGQWVDSTGVPEFRSEYRILRTKDGFRVPGTVRQELDTFEMPIDIMLRTEAGNERQTLLLKGTSADFDIQTKSKPLEIVVDPDYKIIKSSDELRRGVIVRRGIEHFREQEYTEAEQQFQAAIKLNRNNSWAWYNLGLLYLTQRNFTKALDAFDQALNGSLRPDWIEVWSSIYRGNAWDALGQRERAVAEYQKAISNGNNYENAQTIAQQYLAEPFDFKKTKDSN